MEETNLCITYLKIDRLVISTVKNENLAEKLKKIFNFGDKLYQFPLFCCAGNACNAAVERTGTRETHSGGNFPGQQTRRKDHFDTGKTHGEYRNTKADIAGS